MPVYYIGRKGITYQLFDSFKKCRQFASGKHSQIIGLGFDSELDAKAYFHQYVTEEQKENGKGHMDLIVDGGISKLKPNILASAGILSCETDIVLAFQRCHHTNAHSIVEARWFFFSFISSYFHLLLFSSLHFTFHFFSFTFFYTFVTFYRTRCDY